MMVFPVRAVGRRFCGLVILFQMEMSDEEARIPNLADGLLRMFSGVGFLVDWLHAAAEADGAKALGFGYGSSLDAFGRQHTAGHRQSAGGA